MHFFSRSKFLPAFFRKIFNVLSKNLSNCALLVFEISKTQRFYVASNLCFSCREGLGCSVECPSLRISFIPRPFCQVFKQGRTRRGKGKEFSFVFVFPLHLPCAIFALAKTVCGRGRVVFAVRRATDGKTGLVPVPALSWPCC